MLGSSTRIMFFLLVCTGLLADRSYKVSALRNREFLLRQTEEDKAGVKLGKFAKLRSIVFHFNEDQGLLRENRRILEEVNKNRVKVENIQEEKNKKDDSFESNKRRVRRGSDPIHNKAEPLS